MGLQARSTALESPGVRTSHAGGQALLMDTVSLAVASEASHREMGGSRPCPGHFVENEDCFWMEVTSGTRRSKKPSHLVGPALGSPWPVGRGINVWTRPQAAHL